MVLSGNAAMEVEDEITESRWGWSVAVIVVCSAAWKQTNDPSGATRLIDVLLNSRGWKT